MIRDAKPTYVAISVPLVTILEAEIFRAQTYPAGR